MMNNTNQMCPSQMQSEIFLNSKIIRLILPKKYGAIGTVLFIDQNREAYKFFANDDTSLFEEI